MAEPRIYADSDLGDHLRNIRILEVFPCQKRTASGKTNEPPVGTLHVANLDNDIHFAALSYVWGQETPDDPTIRIDGFEVRITHNCYEALICIRERFGRTHIWVDKVCINQDNTSERSHQVNLMGRIYNEAHTVWAWLGTDTEKISAALACLEAVSVNEQA
jgi:hypothetical protein